LFGPDKGRDDFAPAMEAFAQPGGGRFNQWQAAERGGDRETWLFSSLFS